ncbi:MAG TPA: magnesium transporter CorA family protein [Thermoanaerobaculia bacterium]|nr:magnesium transporter CorA family protein [Thermoanaerobaculia bacterium]
MALLREIDPGELGLAGRVKPAERNPPRTVLFDGSGARESGVPMDGITTRLAAGGLFFFADLHAPDEQDLASLQREFHFHPLAIEDVRTRHQRPKIDIYGDQYFLVFYRVGPSAEKDGDWVLQELDFFIGPNFLIVTHDSPVDLLDMTFERFCREEGKKDVSGLLYDMLDTLVDDYFLFLDDLGERSQEIEDDIFEHYDQSHLERLLALKKDLALLRRIAAPERDAVNVLLRRDPPILDAARIFYFQDIYDHLIRIADSIDTYRELATGTLDAFLSVQNNQLSEVVRKLTIISTIFLPVMLVTSFFGMNFHWLSNASNAIFAKGMAFMALFEVAILLFLRYWGILGRRRAG